MKTDNAPLKHDPAISRVYARVVLAAVLIAAAALGGYAIAATVHKMMRPLAAGVTQVDQRSY